MATECEPVTVTKVLSMEGLLDAVSSSSRRTDTVSLRSGGLVGWASAAADGEVEWLAIGSAAVPARGRARSTAGSTTSSRYAYPLMRGPGTARLPSFGANGRPAV